jgi:hypothetical protein
MDTAVWLTGSKERSDLPLPGIGDTSIAHHMIEALREIGLLDDIIATKEGLVLYPVDCHAQEFAALTMPRQRG